MLNREISHYYYTEFLPFVATLVFEQNINFKKANNYGKVICSIEYLIKHAISLQFLIFISLQFFNFIPKYIEFHQDRSQKWVIEN